MNANETISSQNKKGTDDERRALVTVDKLSRRASGRSQVSVGIRNVDVDAKLSPA